MMFIDEVANPVLSSLWGFFFIISFWLSYRGYSQDDFPQRPFQQDDYKVDYRGSSLQRNNMFRPNGKSIYSMSTLLTPPSPAWPVLSRVYSECPFCSSAEEGLLGNANQGGWDPLQSGGKPVWAKMYPRHRLFSSALPPPTPQPPAPPDLWAGRPGAEDAGQLHGQTEEAGRQRSPLAPAHDHGGAPRISGAQRHRDQGRPPHTSDRQARAHAHVHAEAAVKGFMLSCLSHQPERIQMVWCNL